MNSHIAALPHTTAAAREARTQVTHLLDGHCSTAVLETAALLTSELVTNAVLHATPPMHLRAAITDAVVRVEVYDSSNSDLPAPTRALPTDHTGRGLAIVEALASRWGTEHTDVGKVVWFELLCS